MDSKELKRYLRNNPDKIALILESIGCHSLKIVKDKRVQAARPEGDNPTSVQVLLTDDILNSIIHTASDFNGGDIYDLVRYFIGGDFKSSFAYICDLLGISCDFKPIKKEKSYSYEFLNSFLGYTQGSKKYKPQYITEKDLMKFIHKPHRLFLEEGINIESQIKFQIMYDIKDSRICFPIRDENGNIVSVKGRTVIENYKELGIPKYIYYYPFENRHYLYGLYENYFDILSKGDVIVFEAEKSVQKADSYGINNCVSIGTKSITDEQLLKLLELKVDIVLAFDKNVSLEEIERQAKKFDKLANVYAIYDNLNLLDEKDAPIDKGYDTFMKLYRNKIII